MKSNVFVLLFMIGTLFLGCGGNSKTLEGTAVVDAGPTEVQLKWTGQRGDNCTLLWGEADIVKPFGSFSNSLKLEDNITRIDGLSASSNYIGAVQCDGVKSHWIGFKTLKAIDPVGLKVEAKNGEVEVDWTNASYDNLKGYTIYVGDKDLFTKSEALYKQTTSISSSTLVVSKSTTIQMIQNLSNNKTYYISVAPIIGKVESKLESYYEVKPRLDQANGDDNISSTTNNVLNLNVIAKTTDSVTFDWDDIKNTTAYVVYLNTKTGFDSKDKTTVVTTTKAESKTKLDLLDCGRTYFMQLAGRDTTHIGPLSKEYTFTLPKLLSPATTLSTVLGNGKVTVSWTSVAHKDLSSYTLYVGEKADFTKDEAIETIKNAESGVVVSSLTNNKTYYFSLAPNVRNWTCGKETAVAQTPELDVTSSKIDSSKTAEVGKAAWADVNITRQQAMVFWEKINLSTGYTVYFSADKDLEANVTKREVTGIETLNTVFENLSYDKDYYFKVEAKDTTHQGPVGAIYRFNLGGLDGVGNKVSKLNDTGVNEGNLANACASMTNWGDCKEPFTTQKEVIPFGQDGFYITGTQSRGKSLTTQGVCHRDDASKLLWYEEDNRSNYTYYKSSDGADTGPNGLQNLQQSDCSVYDISDTNNPIYCNTRGVISKLSSSNPTDCACSVWRLPTRDELRAMVYYGKSIPSSYVIKSKNDENLTGKANYKPNQSESEYVYWSSDIALSGTSTNSDTYAWTVNLLTGEESITERKTNARTILVCSDVI